ncbi:TrmO family methyltransferase [uncultured Desulfobacter sp.]|uniref:TrmO family methyltransferase domain-containing protein n=1 Tax=uncultured Desulfobacter sp. TaxID=240139 RepID=UPI003749743C
MFSTRRPNPIGLSIVRLVGRQKNTLEILDIDVLNAPPLIDMKPYVPGFDAKTKNVRSGWLEKNQVEAQTMTSDRRFI